MIKTGFKSDTVNDLNTCPVTKGGIETKNEKENL